LATLNLVVELSEDGIHYAETWRYILLAKQGEWCSDPVNTCTSTMKPRATL